MSTGLEALIIFKAKGSLNTRKKYPMIYREDVDEEYLTNNAYFNPNNDYLCAPPSEDKLEHTSPWYFLKLIPKETNDRKDALYPYTVLHEISYSVKLPNTSVYQHLL